MNKRGIVRIMEVMLAITLLSGVILYVYANQQIEPVSPEEYIYNYQKEILDELSTNPFLRIQVLESVDNDTEGDIERELRGKIPFNLGMSIRVCDLTDKACNLENEIFVTLLDRDVFVLETFVASDDESINPHKKVRVFMWEQDV